jgi:hypothetical protein
MKVRNWSAYLDPDSIARILLYLPGSSATIPEGREFQDPTLAPRHRKYLLPCPSPHLVYVHPPHPEPPSHSALEYLLDLVWCHRAVSCDNWEPHVKEEKP